ncbi:MAG TPA: hypothetical protein VEB22_08470 [Phycisphaerales bacterium]|nr:hypothetical protein [Phycisphaerales bacterium]
MFRLLRARGVPGAGAVVTCADAWQVAQERSWQPWSGWGSVRQWSMEQQYYGCGAPTTWSIGVATTVDASNGPDGCFGHELPGLGGSSPPGYAVDGGYYQLTDSQVSVVAHVTR